MERERQAEKPQVSQEPPLIQCCDNNGLGPMRVTLMGSVIYYHDTNDKLHVIPVSDP